MQIVFCSEFVNCHDIRVIQGRSRTRLQLEASQAVVSLKQFLGQNLERDLPVKFGIFDQINFAHSASAEKFHDFVMRDLPAGQIRFFGVKKISLTNDLGGASRIFSEVFSKAGLPQFFANHFPFGIFAKLRFFQRKHALQKCSLAFGKYFRSED
jgi:hypothetical protein